MQPTNAADAIRATPSASQRQQFCVAKVILDEPRVTFDILAGQSTIRAVRGIAMQKKSTIGMRTIDANETIVVVGSKLRLDLAD